MSNRILDELIRTNTSNIPGGYARFQVQYEMKSNVRGLLSQVGDDVVPNMKRCLRDTDISIQIMAVDICDSVPIRYRPDIIEMLQFQLKLEEKRTQRDNLRLRNTIKRMLSKLGDTKTQDEALADLELSDLDKRKQAIITLGANADLNKEKLIDIAKNDEEPRIRRDALSRLFTLKEDADLISIFIEFLDDDIAYIRQTAVRCLLNSKVKDSRIPDAMLRMLDDEDIEVKAAVMQNLNKKNYPATVPRLIQLFSEVSPRWLEVVVSALRFQILNFANLPDDWQPLIDLINDADSYTERDRYVRSAVSCLQAMPDVSAMPVLIKHMTRDKDYEGDPQYKPSVIVLRMLENKQKSDYRVNWLRIQSALQPYINSENVEERRATAQILDYVGKYEGKPSLTKMRSKETDADLIQLLDRLLNR